MAMFRLSVPLHAALCLWVATTSTTHAFTRHHNHHHPPATPSTTRPAMGIPIPASSSRLFSSTLAPRTTTEQQPPPQRTESVEATTTTATTTTTKSWKDDGFVFGLPNSGLERPTGRTAVTVVEGDQLETTPLQVAIVATTFAAHAAFIASSLSGMLAVNQGNVCWTALQAVLLVVTSWILADYGSGVLHWSVDNYGNGKTPIMGGIIAGFQGHHLAPWTITQRGFCNNVHKLCVPFGIVPMALIAAMTGPFSTFFWTTFCVFEILSQEFHKWSHMLRSQVPGPWVNRLQELGLTVSRQTHAAHHMAPYDGNYSIISGITNRLLDQSGLFRRLEHLIFKCNGVESNAWKLDPELRKRTLAGDYRLVVARNGAAAASHAAKKDESSLQL